LRELKKFLYTTYYSVVPNIYYHVASNLITGSNLETTIQQILEMGGGNWDRDTVTGALHPAFNSLERAIEYLYFVILCVDSGFFPV